MPTHHNSSGNSQIKTSLDPVQAMSMSTGPGAISTSVMKNSQQNLLATNMSRTMLTTITASGLPSQTKKIDSMMKYGDGYAKQIEK